MNKKTRTIHGIDPYAPGGIEALLAHHHATFGDAVMEAGEGGDGGTGAGGDAGAGTGDGSTAGGDNGGDAGKGGQTAEWDGKVESLPAGVQKIITDLRKESGDERVATKTLAAIQKALNPDSKDETKPDPEKLTQQLAERDTAARQAQLELAVYKTAATNGGDPSALLDSRAFLAKIADLDPTKTDAIAAAVKEAVTDNPKLSAALAAGKGGADFSGGTGEQRTNKKSNSLAEALSGHYGT
jgi:hypothetical protein